MKKYLLVMVLFSVVLFGCTTKSLDTINVDAIDNLSVLQDTIAQISLKMEEGTIDMEKAQNLVDQLQQKYVDLTDSTQQNIETKFSSIQKMFDANLVSSYSLPLWAKKLGMTEPKGMELDKVNSQKTFTNDDGTNSTMLVYTGSYTVAMQQAEIIAQKANLFVSNDFARAQSLAKIGDVRYISGLDIDGLTQGIVYVNHDLLDTVVDTLLSVSVDQSGTLVIEATKYK